MSKLWNEIKNLPHDASGIDDPNTYEWGMTNGVYYPLKRRQIGMFEEDAPSPGGCKSLIDAHNRTVEQGGHMRLGKSKSQRKPINTGLFAPDEDNRLF